jgi:hypothetical protein
MCSKTLLGTPRITNNIKSLLSINGSNGKYFYFRIANTLRKQFENGLCEIFSDNDSINSICNVDGVQVHKSTSMQFWTISGRVIKNNVTTQPFLNTIFYGNSKPFAVNDYFAHFIEEINKFIGDDFVLGKKHFKFVFRFYL